jgi:hypothetical protein
MPRLDVTPEGRRASLSTFTVRQVVIARVGGNKRIAALVLEYLSGTEPKLESGGITYRGIPLTFARAAMDDASDLVKALSSGRVVAFDHATELSAAFDRLVLDEVRPTPTVAELEPAIMRRMQLHEIQHALDYQAGREAQPFAPLVSLIGSEDVATQLLATMELSAWTATFARDPSWWDLLTAIINAHQDGLPTGYADAFLVDALAKTFDPKAPPCLHDGVVDRPRLLMNALVLTRQSNADISRAARALWEGWFREKLDPIDLD